MGFRLNKQGNDKLYIRLPGRRTSLLGVHVLAPQVICQHDYRLPFTDYRLPITVYRLPTNEDEDVYRLTFTD